MKDVNWRKILFLTVLAYLSLCAKKIESTEISEEDFNLLCRVVYAESLGEPLKGKEAVAAVILNRLDHKGYPKTIHGIIYQKNAFESVTSKSRLWKASESASGKAWDECELAVQNALDKHIDNDIIAFRTVNCKGGEQFFSKLQKKFTIKHHIFYAEN